MKTEMLLFPFLYQTDAVLTGAKERVLASLIFILFFDEYEQTVAINFFTLDILIS